MKEKILSLAGIFFSIIIIFVISQKWLMENIIILKNTGLHDRVGLDMWAIPLVIIFIFALIFIVATIFLDFIEKNQGYLLESFMWGFVIGVIGGAILGFILSLGLGTPGFISGLNFSFLFSFVSFLFSGIKKELEYVEEI